MDITHENQLVIKTINTLIDGRVPKNLSEFPIAIINREHFIAENMSENRGREILQEMLDRGEISILSEEEFEKYQTNFDEELESAFDNLIKARLMTKTDVLKLCEKILEMFGFDMDSDDFDIDKEYWELNDYKKILRNTVLERKFKSPEIGKYKINAEIFTLRRYIETGRDYYNMNTDWITFNPETQILLIGTQPVKLKRKPPMNGQHILEYLLKHGVKNKQPFDELVEADVVPDVTKQKPYYDAIRRLNDKIKEQTSNPKINDFMEIKNDWIYIKDKYSM